MTCVRIPLTAAQGLGLHGTAGNQANRNLAGGHPTLSAAFVSAMLRAFAKGRQCLYMRGEAGYPPTLHILEPRDRGIWRSFLPSQIPDRHRTIGCGADADTLFQARPWSAQVIELMRHNHRHCEPQKGGLLPRKAVQHAVTMAVLLSGGMVTYRRGRSSSLKQNLRRCTSRAEKDHPGGHVRILQAPSDLAPAPDRHR